MVQSYYTTRKYEKGYIINNLLHYIAPLTLMHRPDDVYRHGANFYVDDHKITVALLNCDRKITTTQGYKLIVRVTIPPFPHCEINAEFKEKRNKSWRNDMYRRQKRSICRGFTEILNLFMTTFVHCSSLEF